MKLPFFKSPADKLREEWLVIERLYDQLRTTGESAPAVIANLVCSHCGKPISPA